MDNDLEAYGKYLENSFLNIAHPNDAGKKKKGPAPLTHNGEPLVGIPWVPTEEEATFGFKELDRTYAATADGETILTKWQIWEASRLQKTLSLGCIRGKEQITSEVTPLLGYSIASGELTDLAKTHKINEALGVPHVIQASLEEELKIITEIRNSLIDRIFIPLQQAA